MSDRNAIVSIELVPREIDPSEPTKRDLTLEELRVVVHAAMAEPSIWSHFKTDVLKVTAQPDVSAERAMLDVIDDILRRQFGQDHQLSAKFALGCLVSQAAFELGVWERKSRTLDEILGPVDTRP